MSDWADFHHELSRKTMATLADQVERYDRGEFSTEEFARLVGCLYDVTSGLIEVDVMRVLGAIHKDLISKMTQEETS